MRRIDTKKEIKTPNEIHNIFGGKQMIFSKLTKNFNEVPLLWITFNLNKFKENGAEGSCDVKLHPALKDEHIKLQINNLIDYIRENYDMEKLSK
jgi:hypothetical protein